MDKTFNDISSYELYVIYLFISNSDNSCGLSVAKILPVFAQGETLSLNSFLFGSLSTPFDPFASIPTIFCGSVMTANL